MTLCTDCNRFEVIDGVCIGCGKTPKDGVGCDCPKKKPGDDDVGPYQSK